jgi:hypothetical protein
MIIFTLKAFSEPLAAGAALPQLAEAILDFLF